MELQGAQAFQIHQGESQRGRQTFFGTSPDLTFLHYYAKKSLVLLGLLA